MRFPLCGPTYFGDSTSLGDRCINFIPEVNPDNAKGQVTLRGTPGTSLWATCPVGNLRGMYVFGSFLWVVSNNQIYQYTASKARTSIGSLTTTTGHISFADNGYTADGGNEIVLSDGATLRVINSDTRVMTTISNPTALYGLEFIDGYIVGCKTNSMRARCSDIYDALTWNALATATIASSQDRVMSCVNNREQLWFIKEYSSEVWYNAGVATSQGFPFQRISGMVYNFGTINPYAVASGNGNIYFPARQKTTGDWNEIAGIMEISGAGAKIVTPPSINKYLSELTFTSSIYGPFAYCMNIAGHNLYVLTFPEADVTIVYDATTQMCFEWSTYKTPYAVGRHMGQCYAYFNGKHLIGDYNSGNIYELSLDTYTDYNRDDAASPLPIVSTRIAPHLYDPDSLENVFVHKFQVDMKTGVGLSGDPFGTPYVSGTNPKAQLSWSDDGMRSWSSTYTADIGRLGYYNQRVKWNKLGCARDRVWNFTIAEPIEKHIIGGYIE